MDPAGSSILFGFGLLACAAIVLYAISRGATRPPAPPDHYRTALLQILRNEADGALESLQLVIQSANAPADAYVQMGNLLRARGDHRAAFQVHQSLTVRRDLQPEERIATLRALVEDYRALGQRPDALRTLEELAELRRDGGVIAELARESLLAGQHENAVGYMRELQKLDPRVGRPEMAVFLASVAAHCLQRDRPADAKRFLQQAQKEDDDCPQVLEIFGDLAQREGDAESAVYYWQRLLFSGQTASPEVHEKLEKVYFDLGKFGEIERVYSQVLEKRPRDLATLLAAARIALKKAEAGDAERLLRTALELAPRSSVAFRMLAGLWLDEGKTRELRDLVAAHVDACNDAESLVCPRCGERSERQPGYCPGCGRFGAYEE